jgi:hypothetical protein
VAKLLANLRLAVLFRSNDAFFSGSHFDNTLYNFVFKALKRNPDLVTSYHSYDARIGLDITEINADAFLAFESPFLTSSVFKGIKKSRKPMIVRVGDPHGYFPMSSPDGFLPDYCFGFYSPNLFYRYFPKTLQYRMIVHGLEPTLFDELPPFRGRIKDRILNSGLTAQFPRIVHKVLGLRNPSLDSWRFYRLRTLCNRLPYVDYTKPWLHEYVGDRYPELLGKYRSAIAATTTNASIKYWEIPAAGCLTFMEVTKENEATLLGFRDCETAIFIDESNYKDRFQEYLANPDNPKWEEIASAGRAYATKKFSNDRATEQIVELVRHLLSNCPSPAG